jgi:hypothetical protein
MPLRVGPIRPRRLQDLADQLIQPIRFQLDLRQACVVASANPRNPSNPPVRVTWGEQTHDEMALVFLRVLLPTPADEIAFKQAMRLEYLKALIGKLSLDPDSDDDR